MEPVAVQMPQCLQDLLRCIGSFQPEYRPEQHLFRPVQTSQPFCQSVKTVQVLLLIDQLPHQALLQFRKPGIHRSDKGQHDRWMLLLQTPPDLLCLLFRGRKPHPNPILPIFSFYKYPQCIPSLLLYLEPLSMSFFHLRRFLFPHHKTGLCISAAVGRIVFFPNAMIIQIRPHLPGELHDAVLYHIASQLPAAGHAWETVIQLQAVRRFQDIPDGGDRAAVQDPGKFYTFFSARRLISWNQPSAGRYCSRPGMGDSTLVIRKGMLLFPSCPLVRESIFCSGFSLPESGKVSKTRLTGLVVFSYRIFMTGSLSSTIDSSPSCHCQAAIPSPSHPSQVLLFL